MSKLDDNVLDLLIERIARKSLDATAETCGPDTPQSIKIEYICRAFTEILGVLIVAAPQSEVQKVCTNVTNWLRSVVSSNLSMAEAFGMPLPNEDKSLDDIFKDSFMTAKKALA